MMFGVAIVEMLMGVKCLLVLVQILMELSAGTGCTIPKLLTVG